MLDSYKKHYNITEDTLDKWRVPHHMRKYFREQELNYIALMIHDSLPDNFCERLHPKDSVPQGKLFDYFTKDDNVGTARYKWLAAIKKEYKIFWKTLLNEVRPENMDKTILVMIHDLVPVVIEQCCPIYTLHSNKTQVLLRMDVFWLTYTAIKLSIIQKLEW